MCNHIYKNSKYPFSLATECPYSALFKKWKTIQGKGNIPSHFNLDLPYDISGKCIFHSHDLKWKENNSFVIFFKELLMLHEIISDSPQIVDLREFVLVGESVKNPLFNRITNEAVKLKLRNSLSDLSHSYRELRLTDIAFSKDIRIDNVLCKTPLFIQNCQFNAFICKGGEFQKSVKISDSVFHEGWEADNTLFESEIDIDNCKFENIFSFERAVFYGQFNLHGIFEQAVDFSHARFENNYAEDREDYIDITGDFKWVVHFENTYFGSIVDFSYSNFTKEASFINVIFKAKTLFNHLKVTDILQFRGNSIGAKLFENLVEFSVNQENIHGKIIFEHVNFHQIVREDRIQLIDWSKGENNKIEIGKGCIKYRLRTPSKRLTITPHNQNLVIELSQTFSNFFKHDNGHNLGVEIETQTPTYIEFYYFSDANLDYEVFETMLQLSETEMWRLVKIQKQCISVEATKPKSSLVDKYLLGTDTLINLAALMLKITTRLPVGRISKEELNALNQSTPFGSDKFIEGSLIENLNVNQTILLGIGNKQEIKL